MVERGNANLRERFVGLVKEIGLLPVIKARCERDCLPYAQAMYDGGARVIEVTMTTPGALGAIEAITSELKGKLYVAAGTVLDAGTAREVILHGGHALVNPALVPEVIDLGNRYGVPVCSGAFTATEVFNAMRAGAAIVKIFPAQLAVPKYMTNLKMVFPEVNLVPSGGTTLENAAEYIRCGACAVSGARVFMQYDKIEAEGLAWLTRQVARMIEIIREARKDLPELP
jgi:2-dehydro-3-deoxyphosphogluconate aldolase/(4S)-4-hydroxy-2-oxoglutarate aldolase